MATDETTPSAKPIASHDKGETGERLAAFNAYLSLGHERSLGAVAEQLNIPKATINNWCRRFKWRERVKAIQEEEAARALEQMKQSYFQDAENLRTYKYELLDKLKKRIGNGNAVSVSEIISVLNIVKTELGEPTSIAKGTYTEDRPNPFAGIFNQFFGKQDEQSAARSS